MQFFLLSACRGTDPNEAQSVHASASPRRCTRAADRSAGLIDGAWDLVRTSPGRGVCRCIHGRGVPVSMRPRVSVFLYRGDPVTP